MGLWHVVARLGFFEIPDLRRAMSHARLDAAGDFDQGLVRGDQGSHRAETAILDITVAGG